MKFLIILCRENQGQDHRKFKRQKRRQRLSLIFGYFTAASGEGRGYCDKVLKIESWEYEMDKNL